MKKISLFVIALIMVLQNLTAQNQLVTLIEQEALYQHFSGTALVVKNDSVIIHKSFGYADFSNKQLNDIETSFDIGSVSKQFTAAAILHLVNENKLKLTDNINLHLNSNANKRWKKVTVHQLLSHSSGIPSLFQSQEGTDDIFPSEKSISSEKLVNSISSKKLKFKPGNRYSYSNTGYLLLALIIENISGVSYKDFMQTEIFDKYKLTNTSFGSNDNKYAKPHFNYHSDIVQEGTLFDKSWMLGAGGIYSTTADLNKWISIITGDNFLTEELRNNYFRKHINTRTGHYAYGWDLNSKYNRDVIEHDGTNMGYISYCGFNPKKNERIILLTNQSYSTFETVGESDIFIKDLANKIWSALDGNEVSILPMMKSSESVSSNYQFADGYQLEVIKKDDTQFLLKGHGEYSPSRMIFEHAITNTDTLSNRVMRISKQLELKKFRTITDICDKQMRTVIKTGLMKVGLNMITSDLGAIESITPYYAADKKGKVRLIGENGAMDIDLFFNDNNELMGIFEGGYATTSSSNSYITYGIENNQLYMDGFPYNEEPAIISIDGDTLIFEQLGRRFEAKRVTE